MTAIEVQTSSGRSLQSSDLYTPLCRNGFFLPMETSANHFERGFFFRSLVCAFLILLAPGSGMLSAQLIRALIPDGELFQQAVPANQLNCCLAPGDELWVVSTRDIETGIECGELRIARYLNNRYQPSSIDELARQISIAPHVRSAVYVHGNFTDMGWSLQRGCEVYTRVFGSHCNRKPVRFIIWSWKSERQAGPFRDFDIKVNRAVCQGARLLEVMNQLPQEKPVLIGFSLGVQVVLSALCQPDNSPLTRWDVALLAPAMECDFGCQLTANPLTPGKVDQAVVFTNRRDRALKYSSLRCRFGNCGYETFNQFSMLPLMTIGGICPECIDVTRAVGGRHRLQSYLGSDLIVCRIRTMFQAESSSSFPVVPAE